MEINTQKIRVFARTALNRTGLVPSGKVFCLGLGRTATSSINRLFKASGMLSTHDFGWRQSRPQLQHYQFECFCDCPPLPPAKDYEFLDRRFKGSKFILNVREQDKWLTSRIKLFRKQVSTGFARRQPGWNDSPKLLVEWVLRRNQYHLEVLKYFQERPSDLLVLNFIRNENAASAIADFVGDHIDRKRTPHLNKIKAADKDESDEIEGLVRDALIKAGVAQNEWSNDIYCPSITEPDLIGIFPANTTEMASRDNKNTPNTAKRKVATATSSKQN